MQFLLKQKAGFTVTTKSEQFSPFNNFSEQIANKKSKLFPDRKKIPGRKTKFIFAIAFGVQFFSMYKLLQAKSVYSAKKQQQRLMQRKAAPYFASIGDLEYTISKHRTDLILAEALSTKGGVDYIEKNSVYHNKSVYVPAKGPGGVYRWVGGGTERYQESVKDKIMGTYLAGFNIQNA